MANLEVDIYDLRARAVAAGSVNVNKASAYSLRWHDPTWRAVWDRWRMALAAWERIANGVPFKEMGDRYDPHIAAIRDPTARAAAQEYLDARKSWADTTKVFIAFDRREPPHVRPNGPLVCGIPDCTEVVSCYGRYEGHGPVTFACDSHCYHGNEDGWCILLSEEATMHDGHAVPMEPANPTERP